ncbi:endonuclease III [Gammaproteobacteria bacterium]|nr:endonuclease III [Gammaproteobacteria bacterium]
MKASDVTAIFQIWQKANPSPKTELNYSNPFELLVAVVLSAQATDKRVNMVTKDLFSSANSPQQMLDLGEKKLTLCIQSIGLFRSKAANIIKLSHLLIENHEGCIPDSLDELVALPGVGVKTANVVLNELYDLPTIAVDTHIFRVSNRLGLAQAKTVEQVERQLHQVVPGVYKKHAHHWMILHGRYICQARKPLCQSCEIRQYCHWRNAHES